MVHGAQIDGRWDIAFRDLHDAIGLDADDDGMITWKEVRNKHDDIAAYALSRLKLQSDDQACSADATNHLVDHHTDGAYAVLQFTAICSRAVNQLAIEYRLLFDIDAQHKGLLRLTQGMSTQAAIFSQDLAMQRFSRGETSSWQQVHQYVQEGVWHIWMGYDHLLFLLALLLPSVLTREGTAWKAIGGFPAALYEVVGIVTAFTAAHSITLTLATLGVISLPSHLVESAIALSVAVAALANLYPTLLHRRWLIAFGFGLIHGFGFAGVLANLGLPQGSLLLSLVSFNAGVEMGQLAIVAVFLPAAYAFRHTWAYQHVIVAPGSMLIVGMSCV